ncbi:hypothetical protein HDU92_003217 [Lobulomyces angularis]|nr:hypothetical protein HDU92_003217 [Lobulomyces angularis]
MSSKKPTKPTFAAMASKSNTSNAQNEPVSPKKQLKVPLTPPLSDQVPSSSASPANNTIAIPTEEKSSPTMKNVSLVDNWKAVGSPPRKLSIANVEDPVVEERTRRTPTPTASSTANTNPKHEEDANWNKMGMQWGNGGNSIWNDNSVATKALAPPAEDDDHKRRLSLKPESLIPGQQGARKFTLNTQSEEVEYEQLKEESDSYAKYVPPPKARSRSKSSSAIFGLLSQENIPSVSITDMHNDDANKNIWVHDGRRESMQSSMHRRSSTQPSGYNGMWENNVEDEDTLGIPGTHLNNFRLHERRFSHAPVLSNDYAQQLLSTSSDVGEDYPTSMDMRRRHSLAGPLYASGASGRYLADALENINIDDINDAPSYNDIDDYFENTEHRTRAWVEAGKNLQMQSFSQHWPLYVVEFKAGRHDYFFVEDPSMVVKKGDLAIVEADRGKDLGKVIYDNIQNMQQLQLYQANHIDLLAESQFGKDVHPKRIYRLAVPTEVALLVSKSQDEAKAMSICQVKIRQKKLPMEVVDAEYQWDRRKLTLYFVADRRIDFRELVRDLFKIYKTRIWMCAVNPLKIGSLSMSGPTGTGVNLNMGGNIGVNLNSPNMCSPNIGSPNMLHQQLQQQQMNQQQQQQLNQQQQLSQQQQLNQLHQHQHLPQHNKGFMEQKVVKLSGKKGTRMKSATSSSTIAKNSILTQATHFFKKNSLSKKLDKENQIKELQEKRKEHENLIKTLSSYCNEDFGSKYNTAKVYGNNNTPGECDGCNGNFILMRSFSNHNASSILEYKIDSVILKKKEVSSNSKPLTNNCNNKGTIKKSENKNLSNLLGGLSLESSFLARNSIRSIENRESVVNSTETVSTTLNNSFNDSCVSSYKRVSILNSWESNLDFSFKEEKVSDYKNSLGKKNKGIALNFLLKKIESQPLVDPFQELDEAKLKTLNFEELEDEEFKNLKEIDTLLEEKVNCNFKKKEIKSTVDILDPIHPLKKNFISNEKIEDLKLEIELIKCWRSTII